MGGPAKRMQEETTRSPFVDSRVTRISQRRSVAFAPIRRIGGRNGWYFANWLWRARGRVDRLFGGPGVDGARRDPDSLAPGDLVDFWRVEDFEPDQHLALIEQMRVLGVARLHFRVDEDESGTVIHQTATFNPAGVWGRLYWYLLAPFHWLVFRGMLRGIAREARRLEEGERQG
jgi:hypothetical protein